MRRQILGSTRPDRTHLSCHEETSAEAEGAARASSALRQDCPGAGAANLPTALGMCLPENSISQKPSRQARPLTRGWGTDHFLMAHPHSALFGTLVPLRMCQYGANRKEE